MRSATRTQKTIDDAVATNTTLEEEVRPGQNNKEASSPPASDISQHRFPSTNQQTQNWANNVRHFSA